MRAGNAMQTLSPEVTKILEGAAAMKFGGGGGNYRPEDVLLAEVLLKLGILVEHNTKPLETLLETIASQNAKLLEFYEKKAVKVEKPAPKPVVVKVSKQTPPASHLPEPSVLKKGG
jgi:hypothetical protein